jgi:pantoate--beta-alanine ligase
MKLIKTVKEMREVGRELKSNGTTVAFVPTMGALHRGHRRLMERAREMADVVVVSSFVNPKQFNDMDDLKRYPRTAEKDQQMAEEVGIDYYFSPDAGDFYPHGFLTTVNVSYLSHKLEGEFRPGHFRGVCTVVLKLLNIVQPSFLMLGLKDAQQFTILSHMVDDLCMDVKVVGVPTVRDADGLALSSRNVHLTPEQRQQALCMNRALKRVHFLVKKQGILHTGELMQAIRSAIQSAGVKLEYAAIVNRTTLEPLDHVVRGATFVLLAIKVGNVRLIDNTRI